MNTSDQTDAGDSGSCVDAEGEAGDGVSPLSSHLDHCWNFPGICSAEFAIGKAAHTTLFSFRVDMCV